MSRKEKGLKWPLVAVQPVASSDPEDKGWTHLRKGTIIYANETSAELEPLPRAFHFLEYRDLFRTKLGGIHLEYN